MQRPIDWTILLALVAGVVLAVMTDWNSQLARHSSPLFASWTAHGVGTVASMALVLILSISGKKTIVSVPHHRWPLWAYLGGIPGPSPFCSQQSRSTALSVLRALWPCCWSGKWGLACALIISGSSVYRAGNRNSARL